MNHYVPDFDMDDEHNFNSTSSTITRHKVDDEILELLWQDGQVVAQPQNQRKPTQPTFPPPPLSQPQSPPPQHHLYMAEDEMATWLHYPLEDLYSELLCENQPSSLPPPVSTSVRQPKPPPALPPLPATCTTNNFGLFSRMRGSNDLERTSSIRPGLTVVESNTTPALGTMKSVGEVSSTFPTGGCRRLAKNDGSGEVTLSSSSGTSGGGTIKTGATTQPEEIELEVEGEMKDKKRKQKEIEESNTQTTTAGQDLEHEADNDEKKNSRGHSTTKRSRAAEVHNLSERRRRDRINDRMKALQELIPRCNKSDKASMLDEAIEYLKSLQMQVQMMSMGCNMVPMMYPGMQQYMSPMGMGMGMDMGMARPMMPFPPNIPGSNLPLVPGAAGGPQIGPRFAIPPARMPSVPSPNLAANQTGNQGVESVHGPHTLPIPPGMAQVPNMVDPYQQYMALQQMQMQIQMQMQQMQAVQNQSISQPGSSKPSTSKSEAHIGPSTSKTEGTDDH